MHGEVRLYRDSAEEENKVVDPEPHHFGKPDPNQNEKLDTDSN